MTPLVLSPFAFPFFRARLFGVRRLWSFPFWVFYIVKVAPDVGELLAESVESLVVITEAIARIIRLADYTIKKLRVKQTVESKNDQEMRKLTRSPQI